MPKFELNRITYNDLPTTMRRQEGSKYFAIINGTWHEIIWKKP